MSLLEKSRRINAMLQKVAGPVNFKDMADLLSELIESNVFILSRKGKLLGHALIQEIDNDRINQIISERQFPEGYNDKLLQVQSTSANLDPSSPYSMFPSAMKDVFSDALTTVVPVVGGGQRLGTLILSRIGRPYGDDDLILAEYGATVVGMEILHERAEQIEQEARSKAIVQMAIGSLSFSELEAVEHIFEELDGNEGMLVASKIADRVGITRSVIVNALRKLESAGVIESRSLGMKGTYIRILNPKLRDELDRIKNAQITPII